MIFALLACEASHPPPTLRERFDERAFVVPIDAPNTLAMNDGTEVPTTASTCGSCHTDHYAEWSATTHASAVTDLQYLAELAKPGQPRWLCLNCHAPTQGQRAERITFTTRLAEPSSIVALATEPNPDHDPARVSEGVTCAACHVRRDEDGKGVVIGPRGSGRAPHRVKADPGQLRGVCSRCHAPGGEPVSATFACWFETADEIAAGPDAGSGCVRCHMPTTTRPAAVGGPTLELAAHHWVGGGIPKSYAGYDTLLARGWRSALDISVTADSVTLFNARGAHAVPTADPERHLRVEARLEDAAGTTLAKKVLRLGQIWDWGDEATGRVAHRLSDDRLKPGAGRVWRPELAAPGASKLVVEVASVRLTPANAEKMRTVTLDAELTQLWPEAPTLLPDLDRYYPLGTVIWREVVPLDGGPHVVTPIEELLAESKALADTPLEAKGARFAVE